MPVVACSCGKRFRAIDALAGKQVNCPGCGRPLLIPQASLLDEELAPSVRTDPATGPAPRARIQQRSIAVSGWMLAVLLAIGGVVSFAILATFVSLLSEQDQGSAQEAGVGTRSSHEVAGSPMEEPAHESTGPTVVTRPEFDSTAQPNEKAPSLTAEPTYGQKDSGDEVVTRAPSQPTTPASPEMPPAHSGRPSGAASRSRQESVRLFRGVALAQTLPTGTAMGFSVEYEFASQPPTASVSLFWVIESGKGQTVKRPVQLKSRGTLEGFVIQFRPEHGPFSTRIEDQSGNRLSKSTPLR